MKVILIGGAGAKRTLRTVARHADEWNAWGRPDTISGHLENLQGHCDAVGRDMGDVHITAVGLLIIVDDAEKAELAILEQFLPKLADAATTEQWVDEAIAKTGASSMKDMGKLMGALMGAHKGEIDGKLANQIIRSKLG